MEERVEDRYMTAAVDLTELAHGTVNLDAGVIASDLGLEPRQVLEHLRAGRLAARCEQGIGEDAGRFRLTFLHENRMLRLIVDGTGRILEARLSGGACAGRCADGPARARDFKASIESCPAKGLR